MLICGIDEAGRGPLAGPVYAAAVILGDDYDKKYPAIYNSLNDSKKLIHGKREYLRQKIINTAFACGIGWATHEEIDNINILQAALLAMKRAFENMIEQIPAVSGGIHAIIDGTYTPAISCSCEAMVKADAQIPEVMAASILAKTSRDRYMDEMSLLYPQYGYEKHKGYGTAAHREAIKKYGPSPIQRMSFKYK